MQEQIFNNGNQFFDQLVEDLNQAHVSILFESYIFQNDQVGQRIVEALTRAAKRGVVVKILIDGAGSPMWGGTLARTLEKAGAQTRIFHPFPWGLWQWSRSVIPLPSILKAVYLLLKINSRNHRKVVIIDEDIVFVGSINISQCHLSTREGGQNWRDTAIRLQHVQCKDLVHAFESAWEHRDTKERIKDIFKHMHTNPIFRLNHSWHRRRILYRNLLRRISRCQKRIWITNAYFVPDHFLLKKLTEAARAHVDVRILLPSKSDVFMMPWASSMFYYNLLKSGARIFEYLPSMLHAKSLILDDWITLGSSNLNHRSLLHDLEVDVNVRSQTAKHQIEKQFLHDLSKAQEIRLDSLNKRPWHQRILARFALYMKFWL